MGIIMITLVVVGIATLGVAIFDKEANGLRNFIKFLIKAGCGCAFFMLVAFAGFTWFLVWVTQTLLEIYG